MTETVDSGGRFMALRITKIGASRPLTPISGQRRFTPAKADASYWRCGPLFVSQTGQLLRHLSNKAACGSDQSPVATTSPTPSCRWKPRIPTTPDVSFRQKIALISVMSQRAECPVHQRGKLRLVPGARFYESLL